MRLTCLAGGLRNNLALGISYAQLGEQEAAAKSRIRELNPDFQTDYYAIMRKWFVDEPLIEHVAEGLRKAGLDISERAQPED